MHLYCFYRLVALVPPSVRTALVLVLLAVAALLQAQAAPLAPAAPANEIEAVQQNMQSDADAGLESSVSLSRHRREGEVGVEVDRNRGEKPRVTVNGQGNVWKDGEGRRRVDVSGSADNRGSRRAGVSYKW